jgi:hypothetical protein
MTALSAPAEMAVGGRVWLRSTPCEGRDLQSRCRNYRLYPPKRWGGPMSVTSRVQLNALKGRHFIVPYSGRATSPR